MKKIEAIMRTSKLDEVKQALHLHGIDEMTIAEFGGVGREKVPTVIYRGGRAEHSTIPRTKVEVVVDDERAEEAVDAIYRAAHTGQTGDGLILVTELKHVIRIRTGETQESKHPAGNRRSEAAPSMAVARAATGAGWPT